MTQPGTPPLHSDFDDLWHPAHWRDRLGGDPLTALFIGVLVVAFAWDWGAKEWLPSEARVPASIAYTACLVAAVHIGGLSWQDMGMRRDRLKGGLAVGITAAAAILLLYAIAVALPATRHYFDDAGVASDPTGFRIYKPLVRIPLGTVLLEEVLFRGVILALALRRWSVWTSVLITSVVFGLWHVFPPPADDGLGLILGTVAVTTLGGLLFAWLRLRANSILAPMLAHIATNSLGYLAALVALQLG